MTVIVDSHRPVISHVQQRVEQQNELRIILNPQNSRNFLQLTSDAADGHITGQAFVKPRILSFAGARMCGNLVLPVAGEDPADSRSIEFIDTCKAALSSGLIKTIGDRILPAEYSGYDLSVNIQGWGVQTVLSRESKHPGQAFTQGVRLDSTAGGAVQTCAFIKLKMQAGGSSIEFHHAASNNDRIEISLNNKPKVTLQNGTPLEGIHYELVVLERLFGKDFSSVALGSNFGFPENYYETILAGMLKPTL